MRLGFAASLCLTYPLLLYPARRALDQLCFHSPGADAPTWRLRAETAAMVASTLLIATSVDRLEVIRYTRSV